MFYSYTYYLHHYIFQIFFQFNLTQNLLILEQICVAYLNLSYDEQSSVSPFFTYVHEYINKYLMLPTGPLRTLSIPWFMINPVYHVKKPSWTDSHTSGPEKKI